MKITSAHDLVPFVLVVIAITIATGSSSAQESDSLRGKPPVEMTSMDLTEEPEQEPMYWHEVMGSYGTSVISDRTEVKSPVSADQIDVGPVYVLEYRNQLFDNITVGGTIAFTPFTFRDLNDFSIGELPTNLATTLTPTIHLRTARNLNSETLILYSGLSVSMIDIRSHTLIDPDNPDGTKVYPAETRWRLGIPFGIGFETAPVFSTPVRLRLYYHFTFPLGRDRLWMNGVALGLGYVW